MSTPRREELDQPGRGRVGDGGLQAAAAQDHQRVLLRVQAAGGSRPAEGEPEGGPQDEPEHRCRPAAERHAENGMSERRTVSAGNRRRERRVSTADRRLTLSGAKGQKNAAEIQQVDVKMSLMSPE